MALRWQSDELLPRGRAGVNVPTMKPAKLLLVAWVAIASTMANADEVVLADPVARAALIVPPTYPKDVAPRAEEVKVEVRGTVTADGDFVGATFSSDPGTEAFAREVRDVLKFWRFVPAVDEAACAPKGSRAALLVWFAMKEGKPSVSVSMPAGEPATKAAKPLVFDVRHRITYPYAASRRGIEAASILLAKVNRTGAVESLALRLKAVSPVFDVATLNGFRNVSLEPFNPADWDGKEVICVEYEVLFCLTDVGTPEFPARQCEAGRAKR